MIIRNLWLTSVLLAAVPSGFAQLDRGAITGVITDPSGAAVPEAKITAVHIETNVSTLTSSTASGNYLLPALPIGTYYLMVEASGFKQAKQENLAITAGATVRLDITLEMGTVSESVEVKARPTFLETESTRVATNLSNRLVDDLPLVVAGQMRNVFNLAMVTPEAKSANNYRIGGGQGAGWDMMMDGASQTSASYNYQAARAPISSVPVDAISEFNVETSGLKAEYGRAMGMISYVTKAGGNQMHGNAFEFLRNSAMDARGFFAQTKPVLKQHDFGATGGGPVYIPKLYNGKDRTFFFVAYEGFRNRAGNSPAFYTIPLPEMYQGDFRGWVSNTGAPIQIYDPATTRPNPSGAGFVLDPFPSNQVPVARFSQVAQNYLAIRPTDMVPNRSGPRQNYFRQAGARVQPWNKGSARADHRLTAKDSLSFMYVKAQSEDLPLNGIGPGLPPPFTGDGEHYKKNWSLRSTWNRTITPRMLNSLRFSAQWENGGDTAWSSVDPNAHWGQKLGIKNTTGTDRGIPPITMSEYSTWGMAQFGFDRGRDVGVTDDLSIVSGPHTIKFGFFFSRDRWDGGGQHANNGAFGFSYLATGIPGDQSMKTGNAFASFLLGYVDNASLETPRDVRQIWSYTGGFLQDDWKVNPRLTLNLGLRYEYTFPVVGGAQVVGQDPGFSNFDPTLPNPGAGGIPGALIFTGKGSGRTGGNSPFDGWNWAFSPRIGAAYALRPGTVLRVSGGRFFEAVKTTGGSTHYDGFIGAFSWNSSDLDVNDFPTMLDKGLPPWQPPPFLKPDVANNQGSLAYWDPKVAGRPPEFYSWNLDIQHQLRGNLVLSAGYTGTKGTHLISGLLDINQLNPLYLTTLGPTLLKSSVTSAAARAAGIPIPYPGFTGTVQQALQRFPQYKYIYSYNGNDGLGNSSYHALVLKVDKRYSSGLTLLGSYVLSKMFSNAESGYPGATVPLDYYNLRLQKSLSGDDQTHVARVSFSYELPAGKGRHFFSRGWSSKVLGDWGLAGFLEYASGTPMSVGSGYTPPIYPGNSGARVTISSYDNWRAPIGGNKFDPAVDRWWNKTAFQQAPQPVLDTSLGNATRNNPKVRTPFNYTENFSLSKIVPFREQLRLVVRLETFNLFNRVRWGGPNSTYTSSSFGLITSQANSPRQMQIGMKLYF